MLNNFQKKNKSANQAVIKSKTVLCIPGNWKDRDALIAAIAQSNKNEFLYAGMTLINLKTNKSFELEICKKDERMKKSFQVAGIGNKGVSDDFLIEIDKHTSVIYLISETGDLESAKAIAEAGEAILNSGGIGLKVETAGKAFTKEQWLGLLTNFTEANLYNMFVVDTIIDKTGATYTCGMHNLGLKDSIVYNEEFQEAAKLLSIFGYYQLIDKPIIKNNQTFSFDENSPIFNISEEENQPYMEDELFNNPFGMWKLEKISNK